MRAALKEEAESEWQICSRQMGQHKKKIFQQMFLCLHGGGGGGGGEGGGEGGGGGGAKVRVSDADGNCLAGV